MYRSFKQAIEKPSTLLHHPDPQFILIFLPNNHGSLLDMFLLSLSASMLPPPCSPILSTIPYMSS